jgi:hypothetical protein
MSKVNLSNMQKCRSSVLISFLMTISTGQSVHPQAVNKKVDQPDATARQSQPSKNAGGKSYGLPALKHQSKRPEHLVPPPPPNEPSVLLTPAGDTLSFEYQFMSKEALAERLKYLDKQILDARHDLDDKITREKESKEKAERFKELYQEGVVSRKELEESEKEAVSSEREVEKFKSSLSDLQSRSKLINEKLGTKERETSGKSVKLASPHRKSLKQNNL